MTLVVGYDRVSTARQKSEGISTEAQRKAIADWAAARGFTADPAHFFSDAGLSGGRADNRRGLQAALDLVCREKGTIVVYSLSRLARSTKDCLEIAERLNKAEAHLVSLSEDINTSSAMGRFFFRLLAILAELERELVSERNQSIADYKRSRNEKFGQVPYGYRVARNGKTLVADWREMRMIRKAQHWYREGKSLRQVGRELELAGFKTKQGNARWQTSSIQILLKAKLTHGPGEAHDPLAAP
jgi:site-specific DNA recombinase